MKIVLRRFLISAQIGVMVAMAPTVSFAERIEPLTPLVWAFDLSVLRTLGSIKLAVGIVAMIPATFLYTFRLPFDPDTGILREMADQLVIDPANYVFRRPLGEDLAGG